MITSFFKPKGEAAAESVAPSTAVKRQKATDDDTAAAAASATPSEGTNGGPKGRRRLRKGCIPDDDDDDGGSCADATSMAAGNEGEVTPAPPLGALDSSMPRASATETAPTPMDVEGTQGAAAGSSGAGAGAEASAAARSSGSKVEKAATASTKGAAGGGSGGGGAPSSKAAGKARAKAAEVEASEQQSDDDDEEEEEEEGGGDEDDDEEDGGDDNERADEAEGRRVKPLALKQAKGGAKGKAAAAKGGAAIPYHKYDVVGAATWKANAPLPYLFLARVFGRIEGESKRLLITELMCNAFRTVIATSPEELLPMMALATNKLAPAYVGMELGIGDSIMMRAVAETCAHRDPAAPTNFAAALGGGSCSPLRAPASPPPGPSSEL